MSYSIYPINSPASKLPIQVVGIGYEDDQPHVYRKDGFTLPQIFICIGGEGILKVNDTTYTISRGSFYFLTANTPHEYYSTSGNWEVEWIVLSGNQSDDILSELRLDQTLVVKSNSIEMIEDLYQKIITTLKSDDNVGVVISSGILYEILGHLFQIVYQNHREENSEIHYKINKVKLYIDDHYNQEISLEELSSLVDITPQYLCRIFKKYTNLRPFQYITMKRIQKAKILLSDNKLSVNEIARLVGFNDCSYFCSIFKKNEMMSPTEFRGQ